MTRKGEFPSFLAFPDQESRAAADKAASLTREGEFPSFLAFSDQESRAASPKSAFRMRKAEFTQKDPVPHQERGLFALTVNDSQGQVVSQVRRIFQS